MSKNLTIELRARPDQHGKTIYVGKIKAPVLIDCSEGATFLIFIADEGAEELQIACMDQKDDRPF